MLLHEIFTQKGVELILASQSPRRRQLMSDSGLKCRTVSYDIEEIYPEGITAEEVAPYLSKLKSNGYPEPLNDREILITADTVVILGERVLGKPSSTDGAREMLNELSGNEHTVMTGVTLRSTAGEVTFSSTTKVHFAELTQEQINYYVDEYSPLDKAGSYGIQEWIGYVGVESIEGSFYNVMGLPIQRLYRELSKFVEKLSL